MEKETALKVLKELHNKSLFSERTALETLVPELKESEDEKVRKALIEMVHDTTGDELWVDYNVHKEEALDWLEKQGTPAKLSEEEQNRFAKVVLSSCASSFIYYLDAHKYEGKMCVCNGECEDIENAFQNAMWDRLHRYYCKYIEKQGEKDKPTYNTYSKDVQLTQEEYDKKRVSDEATIKEVEAYKKGLEDAQKIFEKQGEPNPYSGTSFEYNGHTWGMCARDYGVDILCDKHIIGHLDKQGESYTKRDVDDAWLKGMCDAKRELEKQKDTNVFDVPKISIKDAVEVTSRMQYIEDDMKPIADFVIDYASWNLHKDEWNQPVLEVPLFRVLDALIQRGKPYCECSQNIEKQGEQKPFDYENANIQQRDWAEIPFGAKDSELQEATYYIPQGYYAEIEDNKVVIKQGEQNPINYNEELKKCRENPLYFFDKYVKLKEKKFAWSEEEEVKINRIVACLENLEVADNDILLKDVDWLKSLKNRYTWKPSDEQIVSITCAVRKMKESACYDSELVSLFNDLKKLRKK